METVSPSKVKRFYVTFESERGSTYFNEYKTQYWAVRWLREMRERFGYPRLELIIDREANNKTVHYRGILADGA